MYRLYLDEVGVDAIKRLHSDSFRYLSLTGVIMRLDSARDYLEPAFNKIKSSTLNHDPDFPIVFHRTDIRGKKGPFGCLKDVELRERFDSEILQVISDCEYRVTTVIIDKAWMIGQHHWNNMHPYHYLMEIMVEKYTQYLMRMNSTGDIVPEARGKKQDKELQRQFDVCRRDGTRYVDAETIRSRIPYTKLKFRTKKDNIAGLQLCDLLAHPSHYAIRNLLNHNVHLGAFCTRVSDVLLNLKYDRSYYGNIRGYGVKHLP